jgi:murein DD-endopeptidase MepM/ murein hydrolase activator NlpD
MRPNKGKLLAPPTAKEIVYYFLHDFWQYVLHPSKILRRRSRYRPGMIGRLGVMLTIIAFVYFALIFLHEKLILLLRRVPSPAYATVCSVVLSCFLIQGTQFIPKPAAQLDVIELTEPFEPPSSPIYFEEDSSSPLIGKIPDELIRIDEVEYMTVEPFMIAYNGQNNGMWNSSSDDSDNDSDSVAASKQQQRQYTEHIVEPGENLSLIASAYGLTVQQLQMYNPAVKPRSMQVNDKIIIPGANQPKKIKRRIDTTLLSPVNSDVVNSGYGYRRHPIGGNIRFHHGIDFKSTYGSIVKASMDGKVVEAQFAGALGRHVVIRHSNGLETVYGHMSSFYPKTGDTVSRGQVIGRVGSSGRTTGPHLHFEIRKNSRSVNPEKYLNFNLRNK